MAAHLLHELFVVASFHAYGGTSIVGDATYPVRADADIECTKISAQYPETRYSVMTLDDCIRDMRSEARDEGRQSERDSQCVGY